MRAAEESERPAPGETYNPGPPTPPRQAASVILLRNGTDDGSGSARASGQLELLLVKRTPKARFMGGVWVFPGGAVDAQEGEGDAAHRVAAVRELSEEAAITLDTPEELVKFSRWIAPPRSSPLCLALLPRASAGPSSRKSTARMRRSRLVHACRGARRPPRRRDHARLPDDQAPGTARRVRLGGVADDIRARTRRAAGATAGARRGRGRAHRAARRARVLTARRTPTQFDNPRACSARLAERQRGVPQRNVTVTAVGAPVPLAGWKLRCTRIFSRRRCGRPADPWCRGGASACRCRPSRTTS